MCLQLGFVRGGPAERLREERAQLVDDAAASVRRAFGPALERASSRRPGAPCPHAPAGWSRRSARRLRRRPTCGRPSACRTPPPDGQCSFASKSKVNCRTSSTPACHCATFLKPASTVRRRRCFQPNSADSEFQRASTLRASMRQPSSSLHQLPVRLRRWRRLPRDGNRSDQLARIPLAEGQRECALASDEPGQWRHEVLVELGVERDTRPPWPPVLAAGVPASHVSAAQPAAPAAPGRRTACRRTAWQCVQPGLPRAGQLGLERHSVVEELDQRLRLLEGLQARVNQCEDVALSDTRVDGLRLDQVVGAGRACRPRRGRHPAPAANSPGSRGPRRRAYAHASSALTAASSNGSVPSWLVGGSSSNHWCVVRLLQHHFGHLLGRHFVALEWHFCMCLLRTQRQCGRREKSSRAAG